MTTELRKKLSEILGLSDPVFMEETPDKPNVRLVTVEKVSSMDFATIYENIYMDKLLMEGCNFPVTPMYLPIKYMSHAMAYLQELHGPQDIQTSRYSCL
jgi:hypothetical protein